MARDALVTSQNTFLTFGLSRPFKYTR